MKICYLTYRSNEDTGHGIDRYAFQLISRAKQELDVSVAAMDVPDSPIGWLTSELTFPFKILRLKSNVYHAVSQVLAKTAIFTGKHPLVTTFHDLIPVQNSLTSFHSQKQRVSDVVKNKHMELSTLVAKYSDSIIVPFNVTKKDLMETLNVSEAKIHVIPYGVNTDFFKPMSRRNILSKKKSHKQILFFVGGYSKAKGTEVVLRALSMVKKTCPNCELWVAGKWQLFEVKSLLKELRIENDVKFLGHIPEKLFPQYYSAADIFVYPSKIGFGLPILEAMACGTPVITSNTADIKELAEGAAFLVNPLDIDSVSNAIIQLLTDNAGRQRLACNGLLRVAKYNIDNMANRTIELYRNL